MLEPKLFRYLYQNFLRYILNQRPHKGLTASIINDCSTSSDLDGDCSACIYNKKMHWNQWEESSEIQELVMLLTILKSSSP